LLIDYRGKWFGAHRNLSLSGELIDWKKVSKNPKYVFIVPIIHVGCHGTKK